MRRTEARVLMDESATMEMTLKETSYPWLDTVNNFNARYSIPVLVVVGLAGNLLALAVFLCSPLRRMTSSVYLAGQAVTDLLFLTFLGINWLASIQVDVFALPGLCQTLVYVTYVVSFLSLWVIVALTFDLYASISWHCVHRRISRPSRALAISLCLLVVGCGTYAFSFWLTERVHPPDTQVLCLHNEHATLAIAGAVIDSALTLVIPFCLLIFMNVRILYAVASLAKRRSSADSRKFRGRHARLRSKAFGRRPSVHGSAPCISDFGHLRARHHRRSSQVVIQPTFSSGSSRGAGQRKQVSFEDQSRVSLLLTEDDVTYDRAGNIIISAKVIVMKCGARAGVNTARSSLGLTACKPAVGNQGSRRSTIAGIRKYSVDDLRRGSPLHPIRRLSDFSTRGPNSLMSLMVDDNSSKSGGVDIKPRHEQQNMCSKPSTTESRHYNTPRVIYDPLQREQNLWKSQRKSRRSQKEPSPLTRLQYRCFRMVLSVSVVFLCLNVPSHTIRLQSLIHSLIDPEYIPTELEFQLQQFLQFFYYLNFVINIFIYSACARTFRTSCVNIPWHVAAKVRQQWRRLRNTRPVFLNIPLDERPLDVARENSRHVEICLHDIHLSEMNPPKEKPVSPPCLIPLDHTPNRGENSKRRKPRDSQAGAGFAQRS